MLALGERSTSQYSSVAAYQNSKVVERIADALQVDDVEAGVVFDDVKKFLFLANTSEERLGPPSRIDEGWHNFIMFTRDYDDFCQKNFGRFIHHRPYTKAEQARTDGAPLRRTIELANEIFGPGLSDNWEISALDREDCAPDKPCDASVGGSDGSDGG